jgi:hypothetical protein
MMKARLGLAILGVASAATTADKAALTAGNAAVASSDVCKDDEWGYLCNKDAWAGAADAVTGGQELQTAALRRALDKTIAHAECDATDAACIQTKMIVDAQLLDIPKVINSNRLAQVNDAAGLVHPAAGTLSWSTDGKKTTTQLRHHKALYTGETITFDSVNGDDKGSDFVDDKTLTKWVDADLKNGCDDSDGAAKNLAGSKHVRGTAHVMVPSTTSTCASTDPTGGDVSKINTNNKAQHELYLKCKSLDGQGRKMCQAAGCTYTPPPLYTVGFSYAQLTATGVSADSPNPAVKKWRLCMTSPSIADNTVFADTLLTIEAKCPDFHEWHTNNCVCAAGRTTDRNGGIEAGAPVGGAKNLPNPPSLDGVSTDNTLYCMQCPKGTTSTPNKDNTHTCTRCPIGKYGDKGSVAWDQGAADTVKERGKLADTANGNCKDCAKGTYGAEYSSRAIATRYGGAHVAGDVCLDCPKGTWNDMEGISTDEGCKGCGADMFAKSTSAVKQTKQTAVCVSECGVDGGDAEYALVVDSGIWSQMITKGTSAFDWSFLVDAANTFATPALGDDLSDGTAKAKVPKYNGAFTHSTYDLGDLATKRGQMNQCVTAAHCTAVGLFADPISKTCAKACPVGTKPTKDDGTDNTCVLKQCTIADGMIAKGETEGDYRLVVGAGPTFSCVKCPAGKSSQFAKAFFYGKASDPTKVEVTLDAAFLKKFPSKRATGECRKVSDDAKYTDKKCGLAANAAPTTRWMCENCKFKDTGVKLYWYENFMTPSSTKCTPSYCAKDEYVKNNNCVACPVGTFRNDATLNKAAGLTKMGKGGKYNVENTDEACVAADIANALNAYERVNEKTTEVTTKKCYTASTGCVLAHLKTDGSSDDKCGVDGKKKCDATNCELSVDTTTLKNSGFKWRTLTQAQLRECIWSTYENARKKCDSKSGADTTCVTRACDDGKDIGVAVKNKWVAVESKLSDVKAAKDKSGNTYNKIVPDKITCKDCPIGRVRAATDAKGVALANQNGALENPFTVCTPYECAWNQHLTAACYKTTDNKASGDQCGSDFKKKCDTKQECEHDRMKKCVNSKDYATASGSACLNAMTGKHDAPCSTKEACDTNKLMVWAPVTYWSGTCTDCKAGYAAYSHDAADAEGVATVCGEIACAANQYAAFGMTKAGVNQATVYSSPTDVAKGATDDVFTPDAAKVVYYKDRKCAEENKQATQTGFIKKIKALKYNGFATITELGLTDVKGAGLTDELATVNVARADGEISPGSGLKIRVEDAKAEKITVSAAGSGYKVGDKLQVAKAVLGGAAKDLTFTLTAIPVVGAVATKERAILEAAIYEVDTAKAWHKDTLSFKLPKGKADGKMLTAGDGDVNGDLCITVQMGATYTCVDCPAWAEKPAATCYKKARKAADGKIEASGDTCSVVAGDTEETAEANKCDTAKRCNANTDNFWGGVKVLSQTAADHKCTPKTCAFNTFGKADATCAACPAGKNRIPIIKTPTDAALDLGVTGLEVGKGAHVITETTDMTAAFTTTGARFSLHTKADGSDDDMACKYTAAKTCVEKSTYFGGASVAADKTRCEEVQALGDNKACIKVLKNEKAKITSVTVRSITSSVITGVDVKVSGAIDSKMKYLKVAKAALKKGGAANKDLILQIQIDQNGKDQSGTCIPIGCYVNEKRVATLSGHGRDTNCQACGAGEGGYLIKDVTAAGAATSCTAFVCPVDHHVVNNHCVPCVTGKYNADANNRKANGADTQCSANDCAADTYGRYQVVNGKCDFCAEGTAGKAVLKSDDGKATFTDRKTWRAGSTFDAQGSSNLQATSVTDQTKAAENNNQPCPSIACADGSKNQADGNGYRAGGGDAKGLDGKGGGEYIAYECYKSKADGLADLAQRTHDTYTCSNDGAKSDTNGDGKTDKIDENNGDTYNSACNVAKNCIKTPGMTWGACHQCAAGSFLLLKDKTWANSVAPWTQQKPQLGGVVTGPECYSSKDGTTKLTGNKCGADAKQDCASEANCVATVSYGAADDKAKGNLAVGGVWKATFAKKTDTPDAGYGATSAFCKTKTCDGNKDDAIAKTGTNANGAPGTGRYYHTDAAAKSHVGYGVVNNMCAECAPGKAGSATAVTTANAPCTTTVASCTENEVWLPRCFIVADGKDHTSTSDCGADDKKSCATYTNCVNTKTKESYWGKCIPCGAHNPVAVVPDTAAAVNNMKDVTIAKADITYLTNPNCADAKAQAKTDGAAGTPFNGGLKLVSSSNSGGSYSSMVIVADKGNTALKASTKCVKIAKANLVSAGSAANDDLYLSLRGYNQLGSAGVNRGPVDNSANYPSTSAGGETASFTSSTGKCTVACLEDEYVDGNVCKACAANHFRRYADNRWDRNTKCTKAACPPNTVVRSGKCVPCPAGTESPGTNGDTDKDSFCKPILCKADYYVKSNVCTICPAGKSIAYMGKKGTTEKVKKEDGVTDSGVTVAQTDGGGTLGKAGDASQGDTTCVDLACDEHFHVTERLCDADASDNFAHARLGTQPGGDADLQGAKCKRCTKCPDHMTRPAGDLLSGSATTCVAKTCTNADGPDGKAKCKDDGCFINDHNECQKCPTWEDNTAHKDLSALKRDAKASATAADRRGAMCTPKTCAKDFSVEITGKCWSDGSDITANPNCGANNDEMCDNKVSCEATTHDNDQNALRWEKTGAKCVACPAGKTIAAHADGKSLSTDQVSTECTFTTIAAETRKARCKAGEAVKDGACVACPAGFTSAAGDDPNSKTNTFLPPHGRSSGSSCYRNVDPISHSVAHKHGDGAEESELCKANFYVKNHVCTACPAGTTNAAGDDAHYHDTVCTPTLCKANEYVKAHKCVPCPAHPNLPNGAAPSFQSNTAGDDASGPDTQCY